MTLKNRILTIAAAGILIVAITIFSGSYFADEQRVDRFNRLNVENASALWAAVTKARLNDLSGETKTLTRDRALLKALKKGDVAALSEAAIPTYRRLSAGQALDGLVIADTGNQIRFAEPAPMDTGLIEQTSAEKKILDGVTHLSDGRAVFAVAFPLFVRGKPVGIAVYYVLLDHLAREIAESTGAETALLNRQGGLQFGSNTDLKVNQIMTEIPQNESWSGHGVSGDLHYRVTSLPIHDSRAQNGGTLILLQEDTEDFAQESLIRNMSIASAIVVLAIVLGALYVLISHAFAPIQKATAVMSRIAQGDLSANIVCTSKTEIAQMLSGMGEMQDNLRDMIGAIRHSTDNLANAAMETASINEQTSSGANQQQRDTATAATAMTEMSSTVQSVAEHAASAASAAQDADDQAQSGQAIVNETIGTIRDLAEGVDSAANAIERVQNDSDSIGQVLEVIRSIAEQTNLLALNAAIEAARAGEQGRGFAVVADEVRTLASRTQASTSDIHNMIEKLQRGTQQAVEVMQQSRVRTDSSVAQVGRAGEALSAITEAVSRINEMNTQIAIAAKEQGEVAEEIHRSLTNISGVADSTVSGANRTAASSEEVNKQAGALQQLVAQFKV